jgi:hypothetical protein
MAGVAAEVSSSRQGIAVPLELYFIWTETLPQESRINRVFFGLSKKHRPRYREARPRGVICYDHFDSREAATDDG